GILTRIGESRSVHFHRNRATQEDEEVYEVAHLAENSPASLLGIIHPVISRNVPGVNPIVHCEWLVDLLNERLQTNAHRSKPAIEPHHNLLPGDCGKTANDVG